jgi:hypothetical protein
MSDVTLTITITAEQLACIGHDVLDPEAWCRQAVQWVVDHKAGQCQRRLIEQNKSLLTNAVPREAGAEVAAILSHRDYHNRANRESAQP